LSTLPSNEQRAKFTIRVYGILLDEARGILVADEFKGGMRFTKFPGGGLEWGEGTRECLNREWIEELRQNIEVGIHIYTTDFFQRSAFSDNEQLISIYYRVLPLDEIKVSIATNPFDYPIENDGAISFRWIAKKEFNEDILTFPIDKVVARMIRREYL
jgi:8-oxo-dGTP diphosphatase